VDTGQLTAVLPVICHQVQLSTYKLDTASIQSASLTDVDALIKVGFLLYTFQKILYVFILLV